MGKETSAQVGSSGLEPEEKDEGEELAMGPCLQLPMADQCPGDTCYSILPVVSRLLTMAFGP